MHAQLMCTCVTIVKMKYGVDARTLVNGFNVQYIQLQYYTTLA